MTKLRPREVGFPTNPDGAHKLLVLHLLKLWFWLFMVFSYCLIIKKALVPHCNSVQRHVATTSLLIDKLPLLELSYFHYVCKNSLMFFY